ncbi:PAS domain S-box-containing protein/diguanylate cyclase (GGDEF)-like protein [Saccharothrix variisporea]|uniref:PAS domain S-box-containing protein/diguanylate cyclase (GGDEF)-like protein n=2 Tax=Saccharothrix variisporea TaxID=543527 RepID=A0A495XDJ3_9PSEU|nr:PAS domain S-box-containing protein/diguanylate cyclase (GGDEF)-like protein [Saccharothrix variisporea]
MMVDQAGTAYDGVADARNEFARGWAAAIGARPDDLLDLTDRLHAAAVRDSSVQDVGRALVELGFASPATLEQTLTFVGEHLRTTRTDRLVAVLGGIAAGFSEALREKTLDQQERNRSAVVQTIRDTEAALRASEAKFRAVFRTSAVGIAVTGLDSEILDFNDALLTLLDYEPDELAGRDARDLMHPDDRHSVDEVAAVLASGARDHVRAERRMVRADGEVIDVVVAVSLVRDDSGAPAYHVAMVENLDEVRALQSQLLRQSLNDVQTGLANRVQFLGWLEGAVGSKGPGTLALVVFDIDGFRVVNDAFGHEVGNRVLTLVAGHLRSVFGTVGQLARIGPDEFGVLVRDPVDVASVVALVEEAVELLAEPVWVGEHGIGVTASVGIVVRAARGADASELMRCADVTLRWAKDDGKAQWALYDKARDDRDRRRLMLAASVSGGLEQGDFRVDYEPVRSLVDGSLVAVEARLGWDHPTEGYLDPASLASLSACTGMAARLGWFAVEQACRHAGDWYRRFGSAAPVLTMDLTARQCQEPELVAEVRRLLRDSGLPASMLRFELGERLPALINDDQAEELAILAEHGVRFVLDQVGGGNVPVDRLRRLPLHGVKFQGSPVRGLAEGANRVDESAAVALLTWARTLGIPLYAAGVRTEFEARRLRELGVTGAQGPLFGTALWSADEVAEVLGKA